jgi:hypothetical protein
VKSYQTLRGFATGEEPEDFEPSFSYYAILRIFSESRLDFDAIGKTLGLEPSKAKRRGVPNTPNGVPSEFDMWMYTAPVAEQRPLHEHIDALWRVLSPHVKYLKSLKSQATVDVYLGYCSNIDHAGVMVPHQSLEMFRALEIDFGLSIVVGTW